MRDIVSNEFRQKSVPNTCQNWSIFRIFKCKSFLNLYSLFWRMQLVNPYKKRDSKESLKGGRSGSNRRLPEPQSGALTN